MSAEPKYYSCDDEQWYTHDEVAAMFQSFLDKYPDRKRTGTYKGLNYEIELINETHEFNTPSLERDYFAYRRVPITRTPQRGASNGLSQ